MSFVTTPNPTPFGYFDSEASFQSTADGMVLFVKRKMGDDILSCELTSKQIYACFEEATLEYARHIHELNIKSNLVQALGQPTGSVDLTNRYLHQTLEHLMRLASPYATYAGVGGLYDAKMGYFDLEVGRQDYNFYTELRDAETESLMYDLIPSGSRGAYRIIDIFHMEPLAAQRTLLNASNISNFLATNFNYESYVNSTVFYVLPVFEDVLRRQMLETAFRVRRSNYSYSITGGSLRIFPIPINTSTTGRLYVKIMTRPDVLRPDVGGEDESTYGVSGPHNMPYNVIPYDSITEPGRQWIRQYTLALAREILGLVRSKFDAIPIPNADLKLNGSELISQAREDKDKLITQLREFLDTMTVDKLAEQQANMAELINKQLKYVPMPVGKAITII